MTKNFELTDEVRCILEDEHLVPDGARYLVELVMGELIEVTAEVGRDYDEDEGDDPNLAGLLCSGKTRNRVAQRIRSGEVQETDEIEVFGTGLSTLLHGGGTEVHPYSCGSSETPLLAGSKTKKRVLKEGSEQLALFSAKGEVCRPLHIVVAYARDLEGVTSAKVGVMSGREEFAWEVSIYLRPSGEEKVGVDVEKSAKAVTRSSHDRQHVEEPAVKLRRSRDKRVGS